MKYLLRQRLHYEKEETLFHIYPNEFSSNFIRLANKQNSKFDLEFEKDVLKYLK